MKENIISIMARNQQLVKYGIIGSLGLLVDFLLYYLAFQFFEFHYQIANTIAFAGGNTHNFLLNAHFNFKQTDKILERYMKYLSIGLIGLMLSALLLYLFIDIIGIHYLIAKSITLLIITLSQFLFNKKITFSSN